MAGRRLRWLDSHTKIGDPAIVMDMENTVEVREFLAESNGFILFGGLHGTV